jgi:outer membrane protein assembly factor BamB
VMLLTACGSRSGLDDPAGEAGAGPSGNDREPHGGVANGGAAAGGAGAPGSARSSRSGGGAGTQDGSSGVSAAGSSSGAGPDFDFVSEPDQAVTYMIDPAHSGAQLESLLEPPLVKLWSKDFGGGISYSLIVGPRIFVSANDAGAQNRIVYAFDVDSGSAIWSSEPINGGVFDGPVHLAYDRDLVFAANGDGTVVAFDPSSGAMRWSVVLDDLWTGGTVPVAAGGAVFLSGATHADENVFALDQRDGAVVYRAFSQGFGHLTLGDSTLFSSTGCHETNAIEARSGHALWHYAEDCFGGGIERTVFHQGLLFVNAPGAHPIAVLDSRSGARSATIEEEASIWPMSAADGFAFVQSRLDNQPALKVFDAQTGAFEWLVLLEDSPRLPVLITPGFAFVLLGGLHEDAYLYAVDLATREVVWKSPEPAREGDLWNESGREPLQAMAAAGGYLAVAIHTSLVLYAAAP